MLETLKYLTKIQPSRNHKNVASLNLVANYLKERFDSFELETSLQEYTVNDNVYKNVIGSLNIQYEQRLVIGAHYDVCGDIEGADDNASAVAGVIETAKKLSEFSSYIPFRIDFVCFTLEEPPHFGSENMGSHRYVQYLKENKINLIGLINYEMIGYFTDEPQNINQFKPFIVNQDADISKGNFIAIVSDETSKSFMAEFDFINVNKKIGHIEAVLPYPLNLVTASDHLNFWSFGYKAIMITDTAHFRNPNYHTKNDTLETLNIEKMREVIDLVVAGIKNYTYNII